MMRWLIACGVLLAWSLPVHAGPVHLGDFPDKATVVCPFNTNDANGAAVTFTGTAAFLYKNFSATTRTSANGVTLTKNFNSTTGTHIVKVETSDNSDAGFFAAGNDYRIQLNGAIVSSQAVNADLCTFSLRRAVHRTTVMGTDAYVKGSTSVIYQVYIASASTGNGQTGLTSASTGLTIAYARADQGNAGSTAVTPQSATRGSFTSGGFVEKDSANSPGWYEFGIPNAAIATGADLVTFTFSGVAGMAQTVLPIALVDTGLVAINTKLGTPAGASMSADIAADKAVDDAIKVKTDGMNFTGADLGVIVNNYAFGKTPLQPAVAGRTILVNAAGVVTAGSSWRKNTGSQPQFPVYMRDSTTPALPKTGLTLTVEVWRDTGAFGAAGATVIESGGGWYAVSPTASDLNCDLCIFKVTATSAVPTGYTINTSP